MAELAGQVNVYTCQVCGWRAVTKNRDNGTTPFIIRCENAECKGPDKALPYHAGSEALSAMYCVDQTLEPTHKWYRPTSAGERKQMGKDAAVQRHVAAGGLLLRKLVN